MTFPDRRIDETPIGAPEVPADNRQDVIPASERNQDMERTELTHELATESARPLTEEERKAADRDMPTRERVYAPASERVPRQPVPGHRDFVEHPDTHTPERQAIAGAQDAEPSFTRVARPSTATDDDEASNGVDSDWRQGRWLSSSTGGMGLRPLGLGWLALGMCGGVGVWLWVRWRRERNKPINRIRRQALYTAAHARHTANELRERVPEFSAPDAARPAVGLGTALLSLAVLMWQQSRSRQASRAAAEARSQKKRLMHMRDRWMPLLEPARRAVSTYAPL
ncbi:MAG TPA: hypothetical protein VF937_17300 [Chloroflexota bacterium]